MHDLPAVMKKPLLILATLIGAGLLGAPAWSQEADSEGETQVDQEADDESADEGAADEENSDEAPSGDEEEPEAEAESVDDQSADETGSTQEAASGEEEESTDAAESEDAEQSVDDTEPAEEAAPAASEEPAASSAREPGPSSVTVEKWSVTLQSPMGVRESELTMEKPAGGAVVATISHVDGGGSGAAVQLAGNNLSWAWDVTNPMPMQITCEATIQGEQMAGICTLGMFGKAPMHGSRR